MGKHGKEPEQKQGHEQDITYNEVDIPPSSGVLPAFASSHPPLVYYLL